MQTSWWQSLGQMVGRSRALTSPLVVMVGGILLLIFSEYLTTVRFQAPTIGTICYWIFLTLALGTIAGVTLRRLHREEDRLLVSTFVVGLTMGIVMAVFKLVVHRELWTVFNLLAEPMRAALYGLIIGWLFLVRARGAVSRAFSHEL